MILAIIGSPWQMLILRLYVKQFHNRTPIYLVIEKASEASFRQICNLLWDDKEVDFIFDWQSISKWKVLFNGKKNVKKLLGEINFDKVTHICVGSENNEFPMAVNSHLPSSVKRVKIDDGVLDYLPQIGNLAKKSHRLRLRLGYNLHIQDRFNPDEVFMVFPEEYLRLLKLEQIKSLKVGDFKNELKEILIDGEAQLKADKFILVIGQALSEDKVINIEDEIQLYSLCLNQALKSKGTKIFFKPHPRTSRVKMKRIIEICDLHSVEILNSNLSMEKIYANNFVVKVFGLYSNAVVYSKDLFDIDGISILEALLGKVKGKTNLKLSYISKVVSRLNGVK